MFNQEKINVKDIIHIANSEENVSQTIEGLLEMNKNMSSKRQDYDNKETTEKKLKDNSHEDVKEHFTIEKNFKKNNNEDVSIIEVSLEESEKVMGGHEKEDKKDEFTRGHKDVPPIWMEVYKKEDERK